jgi:hypothetical protein
MSTSLYDQHVRAHPAYAAGFTQGRDVGLRIALDALTAEQVRQEDAAIVAALETDASAALPHEYAAGRLHAVAYIVAGQFRQWPRQRNRPPQ